MQQIDHERRMVKRGVERYRTVMEKAAERGRANDNPVVHSVLADVFTATRDKVSQLQAKAEGKLDSAVTTGRRLGGWEEWVLALRADEAAFIALKCVANATPGSHIQNAGLAIARMVELELRWAKARERERELAKARDYDPPNRIEALKRRVKQINPRSVRTWLRRLQDVDEIRMSNSAKVQVGFALLECVLEACPEYWVQTRYHQSLSGGRTRSVSTIVRTPALEAELTERHELAALREPWFMPMVEPPAPYTSASSPGGYHSPELALPIVKRAHQFAHRCRPSDSTIAALNAVQATPWVINERVLEAAREAVRRNVGPLPYEAPREMPASIPASEWERMTKEERGKHKSLRESIHGHNARAVAKRDTAERVLSCAEDHAGRPIWFPHNLDWRGRMYPISQDLHPQADDFGRSLLLFHEGKPLGPKGLRALRCHVAACYGLDKEDRHVQDTWVRENYERIVDFAAEPFAYMRLWESADKPWAFLAAASELAAAGNDPEFISRLPINVDGSCNGLQHLSAMGLDSVGGAAVNLLPGPRQDIYQLVADRVTELAVGTPWEGRVTRKTVKRAVMTIPYGLTMRGMRDQLLKDGWVDDVPGDRLANANQLRDMIADSIGTNLRAGTEVMAWFQELAVQMADKHRKGLRWRTPCGNVVEQSYMEWPVTRVTTLVGRFSFVQEGERTLKKSKTKQAIAPNIIHSYDASHLVMTVLDMQKRGKTYSYAMVHDSFGVHACDVEDLGTSLRRTFVEMYSEDQFDNLVASIFMDNPEFSWVVDIPHPEKGDLDITQVYDSEWFFA
jgi:DNA-directed RNA polymerase